MEKSGELYVEIVDVLQRIERLTAQIELHNQQPIIDALAVEGYQRLREQYFRQMEGLLSTIKIQASIRLQAV